MSSDIVSLPLNPLVNTRLRVVSLLLLVLLSPVPVAGMMLANCELETAFPEI